MFPVLFEAEFLTLYSYPLLVGLAWGFSYRYVQEYYVGKSLPLVFTLLFLFSWFGAKILFLITAPAFYKSLPASDFWLGGGFVFYGGLMGGLLAMGLLFYLKKMSWDTLRPFPSALALGHALGRLGCFLAGCCYGEISSSPLALKVAGAYRLPIPLLESAFLFLLFFMLHRLMKNGTRCKSLIFIYGGFYSITRFGLEYFRGDEVRGLWWGGISTSQILSVFLVLTVLTLNRSEFKKLGLNFFR